MNGFEIFEVPGKGRSMISTKAYNKGDVIFEEEPWVSCQMSWNATYGYAACDHCMRPLETVTENVHRLTNGNDVTLPLLEHDPTAQWSKEFTQCQRCKVRYCSEDCRQEALNRYHRAGCLGMERFNEAHPINMLNEYWKRMHYPPETSTIMLLVRILFAYKQSTNKEKFMETLQSFQALSVNKEQNIYHKMLGDNFEQQMTELFSAFGNAFSEEDYAVFTTPEAFKSLMALIGTNSQGIATSVLSEWVRKVSVWPLPDADKVLLDKLIDDVYNKIEEFAGDFLNNEGIGLYLLQSKINHSCVPNAESTFPYSSDIVVLKALAPVAVGDEICISYLEECQLERSRHSRQKILSENYLFICECPKCKSEADQADETSEDEDDDEDMDDDDDDMET